MKGHLAVILGSPPKVKRGGQQPAHHLALPYADVPLVFRRCLRISRASSLALAFAILTAARTAEVRLMAWSEVDLDNGLWTVPPDRMKAGREHRVPLAEPALAILQTLREESRGAWSSRVSGRPPTSRFPRWRS